MNMNAIIGVIVVVAVIGVGGYFWMMNKPAANMQKTETMMSASPSSAAMMATDKKEGVMVGGAMMVPNLDIVDNAVNANNVTTVVAAVKAAGLVETLKGPGPFTVFAPTNAAFEKLPAGTVETLLKPESKAKLTGILTYHVVPGAYKSTDLKDGMMLKTVNGQTITINQKDSKWWINGSAMVETADVISSNGVTYVIDTVLMPK